MFISKILTFCGCLLVSTTISANNNALRFIVDKDINGQFKLEVLQKPLAEVLEIIAKTTGITLHYADLPRESVTATCVEATAKQILECLLDDKANLIFRYGPANSPSAQQGTLEEVWVLGTNSNGVFSNEAAAGTLPVHKTDSAPLKQRSAESEISELIAMTQDNDPERRADAIATLAVQEQAVNPLVRNAFETALSDQSAEVRAQAVFGLAKYEDADASAGLTSALQDSDVSVRLMVVDNAGNRPDLLQQALSDSDETVRTYAATKLEALAAQ